MTNFNFKNLPELNLNTSYLPNINTKDLIPNHYQLASEQYDIIKNTIANFESNLDDQSEVALKLTSFGQTIVLQITNLSYSDPCLIHYFGYIDGQYAELVQHISQINFLLLSVKKSNENEPPRRIGFGNS